MKTLQEIAIEAKVHMVSEPRLEQFATLLVRECITALHQTRVEGSLEQYLLQRLEITYDN